MQVGINEKSLSSYGRDEKEWAGPRTYNLEDSWQITWYVRKQFSIEDAALQSRGEPHDIIPKKTWCGKSYLNLSSHMKETFFNRGS